MPRVRNHILGIGNADSIILQLPSPAGERIIGIVDCGDYDYTVDYLDKYHFNPTRVQFVVATHPHDDHIKGLRNLLEHFERIRVPVCGFWDNGFPHNTACNRKLQAYLQRNLSDRTIYPDEDSEPFHFGPVTVHVLAPTSKRRYRKSPINNTSIVLALKYGRASMLLGADAQFESWSRISLGEKGKFVSARFLKVPHHGSRRGSNYELIVDYIKPKVAVITGNRPLNSQCHHTHCFPHQDVVSSLKDACDEVVCTHDAGDVVVESFSNGKHEVMLSNALPNDVWVDVCS